MSAEPRASGAKRQAPVVHLVGRSDSGKTTVMEKLVAEMTARGRSVATVKHHHQGDLDTPGKDSWRHAAAGAVAVALVGESQYAVFKRSDSEAELDRVIEDLGDVDIVLVEGFKQVPGTRIEVVRRARSTELTTDAATLFALVTDEPTLASSCARVFGLDDTEGLADAIEALVSMRDGGDDDGRA